MPAEEQKALHWMAVGYVSPEAERSILAEGGRVETVSHDPPYILVALAHDPAGYWSWSHGRREHRSSIEFWNTGDIQMQYLTLQWGPRCPECYGVNETYVILPDEEFDKATGKVKSDEEEASGQEHHACVGSDDVDPFLDSDDLP